MTLKSILQLGLPLGNTFLLLGVIELHFSFAIIVREFATFLFYYNSATYSSEELRRILWTETGITAYKLVATIILWMGAILMGSRNALCVWVASLIIFDTYYVYRIVENATWNINYIYPPIMAIILDTYKVVMTYWIYQSLKAGEVLQPIGKGIVYIWEYFVNDLHNAAKFFIVSEMAIDMMYILFRQVMEHVLGLNVDIVSKHPGIVTEQLIMTWLRFILDAIGLYFLIKEKRTLVRGWCLVSAIQILVSSGIFVLLTIMWRGQDIVDTVTVFLSFPIHLLFRSIVLYFCLRYLRINFTSSSLV